MGHYAGEMGYVSEDKYDYKAVRDAGFETIYGRANDLKRCPKCFVAVEGEYAIRHLGAAHGGG